MVFERNGTFSYLPNLNEHSTDLEMVTGASLHMMAQLSMLKIAQPRVQAKWTNGMASISPSPRETIAAANVPYRAETNSVLVRPSPKLATRPLLLQFHSTPRCRKYKAHDASIRLAPCSFTQPLGHPNVHFCPALTFPISTFSTPPAIDCANKCMEIPVIPFSIGQFMQRAMRLEASCSTGQSKISILH